MRSTLVRKIWIASGIGIFASLSWVYVVFNSPITNLAAVLPTPSASAAVAPSPAATGQVLDFATGTPEATPAFVPGKAPDGDIPVVTVLPQPSFTPEPTTEPSPTFTPIPTPVPIPSVNPTPYPGGCGGCGADRGVPPKGILCPMYCLN